MNTMVKLDNFAELTVEPEGLAANLKPLTVDVGKHTNRHK